MLTIPLADFDAAHASGDEINAAHKERFGLLAEELQLEFYWQIPNPLIHAMQEQHRLDWIAHNGGEVEMARRIDAAVRVERARSAFEARGVSDKAPPRLDVTTYVERAHGGAPRPAPVKPAPTPNAGTAADVDAAMRAVFGSGMEDR